MLVLYDEAEETFETLGIGVLTDFKTVPTVTEVLKGEYVLEFEYLKKGKHSEYLNERNIIKALGQPFRIENIKPSKDGYKILARHIVFDLRDNYLLDVAPTNKNAQTALNWILNRSEFSTNFVAEGDCTAIASARYVRINLSEALWDADNSILNRFGGEPEYDKYRIILHNVRGSNTNIEIREKKNLNGFEMNIDLSTVKTRIQPVGNDGLTLPEIYVDSQLINNYPTPKIGKLELNIGVDEDTTLSQAYDLMRNAVEKQYNLGLDKPTVSLKVNFIELSKTEEYKDFQNLETINLGDRLRFFMPSINQNTLIRVIKVVKNALNGRIISLELGNEMPNIITQQQINNKTMQQKITTSTLEQAKINATKLINHPFNGHLFISEETGELFIANTDDLSTATYIWKWGLGGLGFSKTGINGTFETAWTQDGKFVADFITAGHLNTNVIEGYGQLLLTVKDNKDAIGDRTGKSSTITQDIDRIESEITDATDVTKFAESTNASISSSEFQNIIASIPINVTIHPINENISYLYPNNNLFPSSTLFLKNRIIRFKNTSTNENFDYVLPDDLLYYNSETYDILEIDYATRKVKVTKKCKYNADGTISTQVETINEYPFSAFEEALELTAGNYAVSLPGYSSGYLAVRLMSLNMYTDQYATKVEMKSSISQTKEDITSEVSATYMSIADSDIITNALSTRIKQTCTAISLTAQDNTNSCGLTIVLKNEDGTVLSSNQANITLSGMVKFIDLSTAGETVINGANITTGTISAARLDSSVITTSNFSAQTINASKITTGTLDATKVTVKNLSASAITTGTLDASKVIVNNLNASKITSGTLNASVVSITNLNANNITSGTISAASINLGNGKFSVNTSGYLISSSGKIGGFTIGNNSLSASSSYGIGIYTDGRATFGNDYGWINTGTAGTWLQGNSYTYPCYVLDNYSRPSMDGNTSIRIHSHYGKTYLSNDTTFGSSISLGGTSLTYSDIELASNNGSTRIYSKINSYIVGVKNTILEGKQGSIVWSANVVNIGRASNTFSALNTDTPSIYIGGSSSTVYIKGNVYGGSSRAIKNNIVELSIEELNSIYDSYKNQKIYSFNYKKEYNDNYTKKRYGFILDEMENTKIGDMINILQDTKDKNIKTYNPEDLSKANFIMIKILQDKIEKLEKEVKYERN